MSLSVIFYVVGSGGGNGHEGACQTAWTCQRRTRTSVAILDSRQGGWSLETGAFVCGRMVRDISLVLPCVWTSADNRDGFAGSYLGSRTLVRGRCGDCCSHCGAMFLELRTYVTRTFCLFLCPPQCAPGHWGSARGSVWWRLTGNWCFHFRCGVASKHDWPHCWLDSFARFVSSSH